MGFSLLRPSRHDVYDFISPAKNLRNTAAGKSVLVTGAGTGIGKAIAHTFALAGAASLTIVARRRQVLEECKASIEAVAPQCKVTVVADTDVADEAAVARLFENLEAPPDLLVNNAAKSGPVVPIGESDVESWWSAQEVNLKGIYLTTRAYLRQLQGRKGRIINISSNSSWKTAAGFSSYSISKSAANRFSEFVDEEYKAKTGTRCFALHPGGVKDTDMSSPMPSAIQALLIDSRKLHPNAEPFPQEKQEGFHGVKGHVLMSFLSTAELAAGTCLYLAHERADYLGGRFVSATWDMEALEEQKERVGKEDLLKTRVIGVA